MFNKFIHVLFNSSILVPFILAVGLSEIIIEKNIVVGVFTILISLILIETQIIILNAARKNIVTQNINILKISQDKESWIFLVYITYFIPFIEGYFGKQYDFGNWILIGIGVLILLVSRKTVNNPILNILGYKIYSVETEHGVDMTLISKKDIRNNRIVNKVVRIFEYYIMEV